MLMGFTFFESTMLLRLKGEIRNSHQMHARRKHPLLGNQAKHALTRNRSTDTNY